MQLVRIQISDTLMQKFIITIFNAIKKKLFFSFHWGKDEKKSVKYFKMITLNLIFFYIGKLIGTNKKLYYAKNL